MCHALNLDYFEILVNYNLATECLRREAQLVALINIPKRYEWSRTTVRKFEPTLKAALLDRTFNPGFDASRLLAARDEAFKVVCERSRCNEERTPQLSDSAEFAALLDAAFSVLAIFASLRSGATTETSSRSFRSLRHLTRTTRWRISLTWRRASTAGLSLTGCKRSLPASGPRFVR